MEEFQTLTGQYYVKKQDGTFVLVFDTEIAELWLENEFGRFKLVPYAGEKSL